MDARELANIVGGLVKLLEGRRMTLGTVELPKALMPLWPEAEKLLFGEQAVQRPWSSIMVQGEDGAVVCRGPSGYHHIAVSTPVSTTPYMGITVPSWHIEVFKGILKSALIPVTLETKEGDVLADGWTGLTFPVGSGVAGSKAALVTAVFKPNGSLDSFMFCD